MKKFNIYINKINIQEIIKIGWSWPAFLFGAIWAFSKGLYEVGILFLTYNIIANIIGYLTYSLELVLILNLISIIALIIFGLKGNKWLENKILKKGFEYKITITGNDKEDALNSIMVEKKQNIEYNNNWICVNCGRKNVAGSIVCENCAKNKNENIEELQNQSKNNSHNNDIKYIWRFRLSCGKWLKIQAA